MLIAICDDSSIFRNQLRTILYKYKAARRLHIDVFTYENGMELLKSDRAFDMIFLDYQMPGIDGMQVARDLRKRNLACSIVFVTSYPQFILESFEVQPYRFFVKPIAADQIEALMNTFIAQQKQIAPLIVINDREQQVLQAKDILYLEGAGKNCIVRTSKTTYKSSKTLATVHSMLPQHCFYRSHKSYVVNLYSISSYAQGTATLVNGEIVQIGRSKTAEFNHVYRNFVKDYCLKI